MLDGPLPGGHDVHLFSNVLHDWDETVVRRLLQASARALPAGGLVVVHEAFLNADKTGPLHIAGLFGPAAARVSGPLLFRRRDGRRGCRRQASSAGARSERGWQERAGRAEDVAGSGS